MMDQIIKLKKFSFVLCCFCSLALANEDRMPKLESIGIIPLQWQGTPSAVGRARDQQKLAEEAIFKVASSASRFKILNQDLVLGMWSTTEGRQQLVEEYEIGGFLSVVASLQGDSFRLMARLLSPELKVYLTETEVMSYASFVDATKDDLEDRMKALVFRLFNRMPIDVSITSVQGAYVSLSGGTQQGLAVGDEFDVVRAKIQSLHPADQSWLKFSATKQGRLRVIDVSEGSAVGSIVSQSYEGAIRVGDGMKIPQLKGRRHFLALSERAEFQSKSDNQVVLSAPAHLQAKRSAQAPVKAEDLPIDDEAPAADSLQESVEDAPSYSESEVEKHADERGRIVARAGIHNWSFSGGLKSKSAMATTLLNTIDMRYPMSFLPGWSSDVLARLDFGNTSEGSYTGLGAGLRAYQRQRMELSEIIKGMRYGGEVQFDTLSVSGDAFGGQDLLKLVGFGGVDGMVTAADFPLYWSVDLGLSPLALGQMGVKGKKKSVGSYSHLFLRAEVVSVSSQEFEWGGGFDYGTSSMKAGSNLSQSDMKVLGLLRYRF